MPKQKKNDQPLGYDKSKSFYCDQCRKGVKLKEGRCESCNQLIFNSFNPIKNTSPKSA